MVTKKRKSQSRIPKKSLIRKKTVIKPWMAVPVIMAVILVGYFVVRSSFAAAPTHTNFIDISSPQCGAAVKRLPHYKFGIVGLNGTYMAFGTNPCLAEEIKHFDTYDLYVGVNYPSRHCASNLTPYQCGKNAATWNLNLIKVFKLKPETIWIDVETSPGIPWSTQANNRSYLKGMYDGLRSKFSVVRYYSIGTMWNNVTGGMPALGYNWYASGANNSKDALKKCKSGFGGGKTIYMQYVQNGLDYNIRCP